MKKILFMGDSITDAERTTTGCGQGLGCGYARLVSAHLGYNFPGEYEFFNRGIGGNRTVDLLGRIQSDCIGLKPDILTIMIGVNDAWNRTDGISPEVGFELYDLFVRQVKEALPNIKILILEPFAFYGKGTQDIWDTFEHEIECRAEMSRQIAEKYDLPFVRLKPALQNLIDKTNVADVCYDGVHPTCSGHEVISRVVYEELKKIL